MARKKLPKYLTEEEVRALINIPYKNEKKHRLILRVLASTGMRISEVVGPTGFTPGDVVMYPEEQEQIMIRDGKGGRDRAVPIADPLLLHDLVLYMEEMDVEEPVFPMTRQAATRMVSRYAERAGIKRKEKEQPSAHTLRHSYAVSMVQRGMNLRNLQKILGHASLETTAIYLELTLKDIHAEARKVGVGW